MANQNQSADSSSDLQNIPAELKLKDNGWYFYDTNSDNPRTPRTIDGNFASWKSDDGYGFREAVDVLDKTDEFDTIGYRFTEDDDYIFIDFDGCLSESYNLDSKKEWSPEIEKVAEFTYTEFSSSGTGAHSLFKGEIPEWWEDAEEEGEHEGIEIFGNRMCIFSGDIIGVDRIKETEEFPVDFEDLLMEFYQMVEGEAPDTVEESTEERTDEEIVETYEGDVFEALDDLDPQNIKRILWSEYQQSRNGTFEEWNPGYRQSKSGTSLIHNKRTGTWFDFARNNDGQDETKLFGTLELFAAERDRIGEPEDELSGQEWVNAYKDFRSKCEDAGVQLPSLEDNKQIITEESIDWETIREQYAKANRDTEKGKCGLNVARKLMSEDDWMKVRGSNSLYLYEDGTFEEDRENDYFKRSLNNGLMWEYSRSRKNKIYDMMTSRCLVERDEVGCDDGMVVVDNGVVDVVNEELHEHSPDYKAVRKLPVEYDSDVDDPEVFLEFLDDVLMSEDDKMKIQEFFGYSLIHWGLPFHKSLFLVGPTNSGKSTLLDILQMMHDDDAVSHLTPQEITNERFTSQQLDGSWLNVRNDIPSETVNDVGLFKELIAGDEIKVERKGQDPYNIEPVAKHAYAGNQLPTASVDDSAFYERVLLVSLPRTIPREDQDKNLLKKISRELPSLLNWAIEGLHRLMKQEGFTRDMSASETEQMWQNWSSSVKRFIHECLRVTKDDGDKLAKEAVMDTFRNYTDIRGMPSASKKTLTQTVTSKAGVSHTNYGGTDGSGEYTGIELNEKGEKIFEQIDDGDLDELQDLFQD